MNKTELWKKVERDINRKVDPALRKELDEDCYVADALDSSYENGYEALVRRVKRRHHTDDQREKRKPPPGRKARAKIFPSLHTLERARAQALSKVLGHTVATIPRIRRLREDLLGGTLLSPEQADRFLRSPALRCLSQEDFQEYGIRLIDHHATIVKPSILPEDEIEEEMEEIVGEIREINPPRGRQEVVTVHIEWPEGHYTDTVAWQERPDQPATWIQTIRLAGQGWSQDVDIWPLSVLSALHDCSTWLAARFPWSACDALWFVLTGAGPRVAPIQLGVHATDSLDLLHYQITLSVAPWVSGETVLQAYRAVQSMVLQGRDNRPLQDRSLTLARFIAALRSTQSKRLPWKSLMEAWNRSYPQWSYAQVSNFAKDVDRAESALLSPPYADLPQWQLDMDPEISWESSFKSFGE